MFFKTSFFLFFIIFLSQFYLLKSYAAPIDLENKSISEYLKAINLSHDKKYEKAIKILLAEEKKLLSHPLQNEIHFLLASCYFKIENFEKSAAYFEKIKNFAPIEDYVLFFLAKSLQKSEKQKDSLALFQKLISKHPKSIWESEASIDYFLLNYELKNYKTVINTFTKHRFHRIRLPADKAGKIYHAYADSNLKLNRNKEAYRFFKRLIIKFPKSSFTKEAFNVLKSRNQKFNNYELQQLASSQLSSQLYGDALKTINELALKKSNEKKVLELKADLFMRKRNWHKSIEILNSLLNKEQTPGNLYNLAKSNSRTGNYPQARYYYKKLAEKYPHHNLATQSLFLTSKLYTYEGNYKEAINTLSVLQKKYPKSTLYNTSIWETGWSYYNLENFEESILTWDKTAKKLDKNDSHMPQLLYWKARAFSNKKDNRSSSILYREIVERYPLSYYSFQAQNRLLEISPTNIEIINNIQKDLEEVFSNTKNISCLQINFDSFKTGLSPIQEVYFLKAQSLIKVGFDKYASNELFRIQQTTNNKDLLLALSKLFYCINDYNRSQYIARVYFKDKLEGLPKKETIKFWKLAFPTGFSTIISKISEHVAFSPFLVFSLIRAESNFKPDVVSHANAKGLMQIIPYTGNQIAKKLNDEAFDISDLFDPKTNIAFGTWYLNSLIEKFNGNTILAIPSYNAGPHRVEKWLRQFGSLKIDEFIETIPYTETRNYVKKVVRNYGVYKTLYSNDKSILRLSQKLHLDKALMRTPAGKSNEDWSKYKEGEDLRPKLLLEKDFSKDKLSIIEYFSSNSFKNHVNSGRFF